MKKRKKITKNYPQHPFVSQQNLENGSQIVPLESDDLNLKRFVPTTLSKLILPSTRALPDPFENPITYDAY